MIVSKKTVVMDSRAKLNVSRIAWSLVRKCAFLSVMSVVLICHAEFIKLIYKRCHVKVIKPASMIFQTL